MGVDQRLAPIELLPDRCEGCVAEIFVLVARHQADAVGLERVERVFDFLETALRVEQRNGRETGKTARVVPCELRTELVAEARHSTSLLDVRDRRARLDQRKYRCGDAALVHVFDRHGGRPLERGARTPPADFLEIAGVHEVVVNVYTVWLAARRDGRPLRLLRHQPAGKRAGSTQRGKLAQETTPWRTVGQAGTAFKSGHRALPPVRLSRKVSYHGVRGYPGQHVDLTRDFRNLVHPGRAIRLGRQCNRATALSALAGIEHVVNDL